MDPLYKFMAYRNEEQERLRNLLTKGDLWFSCLGELNDPHEGKFRFTHEDLRRGWIHNISKTHKALDAHAAEKMHDEAYADGSLDHNALCENYWREISSRMFSTSFSEDVSSQLMWSHYTQSHHGLAVEFSFPPGFNMLPLIGKGMGGMSLKRVSYLTEPPLFRDFITFQDMTPYFSKGMEWAYEKEVRSAFIDDELCGKKGAIRTVDPAFITGVYLGLRCPLRAIDIRSWRNDIAVYRMRSEVRRFELTPIREICDLQ